MRFDELTDATVIWGAGREGRAALQALRARGLTPRIAVTGEGAIVPNDLADVTVIGPEATALLDGADAVVKSPGIAHTAPEYQHLKQLGVVVTSLTDLWLNENADRVIAVTGTKGKSTTSALIAHILDAVGISTCLVGNGGVPVTEGDNAHSDVAVTEVSSYQAADLTTSPRISVVTSLYPEHLPWHGSFEQYTADKLNLIRQRTGRIVIPDGDDALEALVLAHAAPGSAIVRPSQVGVSVDADGVTWDGAALEASAIPLRGLHNLHNVALALAAVQAHADLDPAGKQRALAAVVSFRPLAHRLEPVATEDGRLWVDDSLATAPEAVVAALDAYATASVTLVAGGADRGLSFAPLIGYLSTRQTPVHVIASGPAGARLVEELEGAAVARLAPDFATALTWAGLDDTEVVLLSPGAPSFDEFASYEERSAAFRAVATGQR